MPIAALESAMKTNNISPDTKEDIRQGITAAMNRRKEKNVFNQKELRAMDNLKRGKKIIILPADEGE
ncbi:unnamed protein product [Echinostoma caproni]|uniref:GatB_Yqey domain-containing protein n=1 Tax=Echinostoma caproni TaxID=27848 RepID=A0A183A4G4_9TREM|nr:unnamed protein product [Echinostoma caproni]